MEMLFIIFGIEMLFGIFGIEMLFGIFGIEMLIGIFGIEMLFVIILLPFSLFIQVPAQFNFKLRSLYPLVSAIIRTAQSL